MDNKKRGFFERLTGSISMKEDYEEERIPVNREAVKGGKGYKKNNWIEEEAEEAELAIDVYETPTEIVLQTMVAGVRPEDLDVSIARDVITISGKREESRVIDEDNYFTKELYWGKFSRSISLPQEVEPEEVEATEKHGLLTIRIKKVDKAKKNSVRVKSL